MQYLLNFDEPIRNASDISILANMLKTLIADKPLTESQHLFAVTHLQMCLNQGISHAPEEPTGQTHL